MMDAVRTHGLVKRYGSQVAAAGVDLVVPGSFAGLVGPNGAGKTTTLSMIAALLRPDGGHAEVDGLHVCRRPPDLLGSSGLVQ
ncbi:ATP-binding cassette domain-containing protein [Nonomuraea sp. B1E8]|uniref:ATP-binding cassette domain-containing protein n=1 Tax=unclassified Nonomuraea TaxID=2593643 RepID=UPI00325E7CF6